MTLQDILHELEKTDGAILWWTIKDDDLGDWCVAVERKEITFDFATDCFVHPGAEKTAEGGYMLDRRAEDFKRE